jgi:hypothetical protein
MKKLTAALWFSAIAGLASAAARGDEAPYILNSSAGAQSGANRLGSTNINLPPHAWTAVGQKPDALSTDDVKKEHPRNRAVVGPPVPRDAKVINQPAPATPPPVYFVPPPPAEAPPAEVPAPAPAPDTE